MTLANYQFQFNNLTFGGAGSVYQIESVDGLESLPELRVQDDNRGFNDGMFTGRDFLAGRTISMIITTFEGNGQSAQANFNALQAALIPQQQGTTPLNFLLSASDEPMTIGARVRSRLTTINPEYTYGLIRSQYTFFCPDPRYYSASSSQSLLPTTALGRTYDRTYNLVYGGGSAGTTIYNPGSVTTYPTITISGPITNPTIGDVSTGAFITVNTTLTALDTLVIDLYNKIITLNGSSARNLMAGGSTWFGAAPGYTSFQFTGTAYTIGTTVATVTFAPAYI